MGVTEMMNGFALVLATVLLMVVHTWRFRWHIREV